MNTEEKKNLLADVRDACRALGQILDGGHDLSGLSTFPRGNVATLRDQSMGALGGLCLLEALLVSEIGTDNL
jgi:hypothetical protein